MKTQFSQRLRLLFTTALILTVTLVSAFMLTLQYNERQDFLTELLLQKNNLIAASLGTSADQQASLENIFSVPDWTKSVVFDEHRKVQYPEKADTHLTQLLNTPRLLTALNGAAEGVLRNFDIDGGTFFVAYKMAHDEKSFIITTAPKSIVLRMMWLQILLAVFFILAVAGGSLFVVDYFLHFLTGDIEILKGQVQKIGADGAMAGVSANFNTEEFNSLAQSFNDMARQIAQLLEKNKKIALVDAELTAARRVQESMFPEQYIKKNNFEVNSYFEPAQDCGGDWLYYYEKNDCLWLAIGDVTGHGLPSALMTAAAKAAFSVYQNQDLSSPSAIMESLNKVIFNTTQGSLQMTFLLVKIDLRTRKLTYTSASHEGIFIVSPAVPDVSAASASLESERHGKRLGETPDTTYTESSLDLPPNVFIFTYTDGIFEIKDQRGANFSDAKLKKLLAKLASDNELLRFSSDLKAEYTRLKRGGASIDDTSWIIAKVD